MSNQIQRNIEFLCDNLFNGSTDSVLLYGEPQNTSAVLKGVYSAAKNNHSFLCSWHDGAKIAQPMDFFGPILKLKYREEYGAIKEKKWFKDLTAKDSTNVFALASLCAQEKGSADVQKAKTPLIFIDGIEDLFFNMDFGHLDKKEAKKIFGLNFLDQPTPKGFGNNLRAHLHQSGLGIFYGSVLNPKSMQCNATLNNYHYLFYSENFRAFTLWK